MLGLIHIYVLHLGFRKKSLNSQGLVHASIARGVIRISENFIHKKIRKKNIRTSKFSHTVYVTKKQGCRKEEKICLKTNLHLSTKRQQQQSETSRTSSGCTELQGHCRRSALLSHPVLMPKEKDSEKCLCSDSDKEEKICAKR